MVISIINHTYCTYLNSHLGSSLTILRLLAPLANLISIMLFWFGIIVLLWKLHVRCQVMFILWLHWLLYTEHNKTIQNFKTKWKYALNNPRHGPIVVKEDGYPLKWLWEFIKIGAVHKVRHARRGRGSEKVWQFVTEGRGFKSMWRYAYNFFYLTYETWNLKWYLTFCCNRCILTEGGTDKNHPGQSLPDKRPPDKPLDKTPANNWQIICTEGFCPGFLY